MRPESKYVTSFFAEASSAGRRRLAQRLLHGSHLDVQETKQLLSLPQPIKPSTKRRSRSSSRTT